jgi:hypothetical protein
LSQVQLAGLHGAAREFSRLGQAHAGQGRQAGEGGGRDRTASMYLKFHDILTRVRVRRLEAHDERRVDAIIVCFAV